MLHISYPPQDDDKGYHTARFRYSKVLKMEQNLREHAWKSLCAITATLFAASFFLGCMGCSFPNDPVGEMRLTHTKSAKKSSGENSKAVDFSNLDIGTWVDPGRGLEVTVKKLKGGLKDQQVGKYTRVKVQYSNKGDRVRPYSKEDWNTEGKHFWNSTKSPIKAVRAKNKLGSGELAPGKKKSGYIYFKGNISSVTYVGNSPNEPTWVQTYPSYSIAYSYVDNFEDNLRNQYPVALGSPSRLTSNWIFTSDGYVFLWRAYWRVMKRFGDPADAASCKRNMKRYPSSRGSSQSYESRLTAAYKKGGLSKLEEEYAEIFNDEVLPAAAETWKQIYS